MEEKQTTARAKLDKWLEDTAWLGVDRELGNDSMRCAPERPKDGREFSEYFDPVTYYEGRSGRETYWESDGGHELNALWNQGVSVEEAQQLVRDLIQNWVETNVGSLPPDGPGWNEVDYHFVIGAVRAARASIAPRLHPRVSPQWLHYWFDEAAWTGLDVETVYPGSERTDQPTDPLPPEPEVRLTRAQRRARSMQPMHNNADVCPQHGPTRGGTCMRCRR